MSYVQLSEGGFQVVYPLGLWPPVLRSCQSPIWIWLVNYLHLYLHLQLHPKPRPASQRTHPRLCGQPSTTLLLVRACEQTASARVGVFAKVQNYFKKNKSGHHARPRRASPL